MVSQCAYDSNITTTVFSRSYKFDTPVLCARSIRKVFAYSFGSFSATSNVFRTTASVSAPVSPANSAIPSMGMFSCESNFRRSRCRL
ncbi:hypothetical protein NP493_1445g00066 [Ridgeia piscesae]|uniref:Uncharacterized protein n=1 Tax=Ridgeia piscesae TaxID=27915 RepID=A0AAD9K345_RIDPI|nr:hypothetical protein NP493_1445g00066 [Ridgeia piscesae]